MSPMGSGGIDLPPFFRLFAFESLGSSNVEARRLAEAGEGEGAIVWTHRQEQGVGRRGRSWSSPAGNLYCSVILRPECSPAEAARLSFLIALAIRQAVATFLPPDIPLQLKWPNDVLIDGRKCAGILLESKMGVNGLMDYVIVGTGINITSYPEKTDGLSAISLEAAGARVRVEELLSGYAYALLDLYMRWRQHGFGPIHKEWISHATGIGTQITVRLANETLEGKFVGLDPSGALVLGLISGETRLITAGEVFFPALQGHS